MKVYVLIGFEDYEGSDVKGVVATQEQAERWTKTSIETLHKKPFYNEFQIEKLPSGYKNRGHGFIYEEHEVVYP